MAANSEQGITCKKNVWESTIGINVNWYRIYEQLRQCKRHNRVANVYPSPSLSLSLSLCIESNLDILYPALMNWMAKQEQGTQQFYHTTTYPIANMSCYIQPKLLETRPINQSICRKLILSEYLKMKSTLIQLQHKPTPYQVGFAFVQLISWYKTFAFEKKGLTIVVPNPTPCLQLKTKGGRPIKKTQPTNFHDFDVKTHKKNNKSWALSKTIVQNLLQKIPTKNLELTQNCLV